MKFKLFISLFVVLVSLQTIQAQTFGGNQKNNGKQGQATVKPDVKLSLGTSFTSFYPGLNGFSSWIAPEISMPLGKKWTVSAGLAYSNFITGGTPGITGFGQTVQNYGTIYVSGRYQVNPKLAITASGYKTFSLSPVRQKETVNPRALDFSNSGATISIDYKVNDHFRINAAFSMQQRRYNPFSPYGYGSYYGSPYSPAVPGGFYPGF
jgi:hypothetical protein